VHTGSLDELARRWRAIWEVGRRIAVLDGVTALQASGLTGFHEYAVHVSVPHTATIRSVDGVVIHKVRRRSDHLVILVTRPAPTVRPPSRMANLRPSSMAIGWISSTAISVLSPGMTISVPSGSLTTPVTSVVRK
jgi:hypothetical protein